MTTDTIGGVWTFTQELTAGLLAQGCEIALVSLGRSPNESQARWATEIKKDWGSRFRFETLAAELEWMQHNERAFADAAPALLHLASDFEADLLHLNQFCFGALETDLPKVITAHSDVLSWGKYCRSEGIEDSAWLRRYQRMVASGLAHADVLTAPTQWMLDAVAENFTVPTDSVVISNGRSIPASPGHPGKDRKLQAVTAGRLWDEAKNIALLREVSSPMPLLVAGESAWQTEQRSTSDEGVTFLGMLNSDDLFALLQESALYICASIYEPFGLAPLEAALCGCAVLANDLPPLREVWGEGALYFRDAAELSALLAKLTEDRELIVQAQARSRERAGLYTREKTADGYLQVFSHAVALTGESAVAHVA